MYLLDGVKLYTNILLRNQMLYSDVIGVRKNSQDPLTCIKPRIRVKDITGFSALQAPNYGIRQSSTEYDYRDLSAHVSHL